MKHKAHSANIILFLTLFLIQFICLSNVFSQPPSPSDSHELLIRFEPGTDPALINAWKNEVSAMEEDITPLSQMRLWKVDTFPTNNGAGDINEVIAKSKSEAIINSVGKNFIDYLPLLGEPDSLPWNPTAHCPVGFSTVCPVSNNFGKSCYFRYGDWIHRCRFQSNISFCPLLHKWYRI